MSRVGRKDTAVRKTETLAVVIPVYRGEHSIRAVVEEVLESADTLESVGMRLDEVVLVHDGAVDNSADVLLSLADESSVIRPVWLSRNFGQHPATLAGISSTTADWIVTMDEDGLHDPASICDLIDEACHSGADLVYGMPDAAVHHPRWRNVMSAAAKRIGSVLLGDDVPLVFSSFRLISGGVARALAAYCGPGVYVDVALRWVVGHASRVPVPYRKELREESGYTLPKLLSHFRRLVLTSGTRPLRLVATLGLLAMITGLTGGVVVVALRLFGEVESEGWASLMIAVTMFSGLTLLALGTIAEYLGVAVGMATGRPPYLIVGSPPCNRPHDDHEVDQR